MKKWIICTGPDWYRPSVTSTRQIMLRFEEEYYSILWINPIAFKSPSVNSENRTSSIKKILNKLKTHLKLYNQIDKRIHVYVPLYLPLFTPLGDKINSNLIKLQLILISKILKIRWKDSILWISGNFTLSSILKYNFKVKVYQAADLISDFRTTDDSLLLTLRQKEIYLSQNVHYLFASSPNIKIKLEKLSQREVHLLTHGVDFDHFNRHHNIHSDIVAIKNQGLPIAGYYGTLSDANDKQVFSFLADNGFSVIIIGKILGDYRFLENKKNIYFIGPVNFKELPSYAQAFDVCLLNWIMADWIINSFPVKSLEYLAMGKPIISCRIPVLEELFGSFIYFADSPEDYLFQAKKSLLEDNDTLRLCRVEIASRHKWKSKYNTIKSILNEP